MKSLAKISYLIAGSLAALPILWVSPVHAANKAEINIFYPGSGYDVSTLQSFQQKLGVHFTAAKWYQDFSQPFDQGVANRFHAAGFVPELTWQPQTSGSGVSYDDVVAGHFDTYLAETAQSVKSLGYTVRISMAPELNESWVPWGIGKVGNTDQNEKGFWRYVVQKFRTEGATNVEWIWAPNIQNGSETYTYAQLYPGDDYVTYVGLDGYNWGTTRSWSNWQSFSSVFSSSYAAIGAVSSKNIEIMETASTEAGGNKADWIAGMFTSLKTEFPRIQGVTWFDMNKETDWRIDSTSASQKAFSDGYNGVVPQALATPAPVVAQVPVVTPVPAAKPAGIAKTVPSIPQPTAAPVTQTAPVTAPVTATVINPAVPAQVVAPTLKKQPVRSLAAEKAPLGSAVRSAAGAIASNDTAAGNQARAWWTILILALIALRANQPKRHVLRTDFVSYRLGNRS
jgi:hypothetical protein